MRASSSSNDDLSVPPGDVQFIEKVGQGGYGEVWKGKWKGKGGGITVAIKKVPVIKVTPNQQRAILMEVDILIKLRHPNILLIFGACFVEQQELWIITEYMEGGNLYEWLHSDLEISWDVRLRLAHQAALAINVLHSSVPCVLHRDVKSLNFMVSLDGNVVKLIDFGLSKVSSVASQTVSTLRGGGVGTVRWNAPETMGYPAQWTPKADIYSLGITFHEIASRKDPYEHVKRDDEIIRMVQELRLRPPIPPECPADFATIMRECWHDDPRQRPTSLQLLEKIEAVMEVYSPMSARDRFDTTGMTATLPDTSSASSIITPSTTIAPNNSSTRHSVLPATTTPSTAFLSASISSSTTHPTLPLATPSSTITHSTVSTTSSAIAPAMPSTKASASAPIASTTAPVTAAAKFFTAPAAIFPATQHPIAQSARLFYKADMVTTAAGSEQGSEDGSGLNARFNYPFGLCFNPRDKCLYICDQENDSIRKLTMKGEVTTFVRKGSSLKQPSGIAMNFNENVFYVTNYGNHTISKITSSGDVHVFAGSGELGGRDGLGTKASFSGPTWIAVDQRRGILFVSNRDSHTIRKITSQGEVSTIAGEPKFRYPEGICYDEATQSLIVCDWHYGRLLRVQLNGSVTTMCEIAEPKAVVMTASGTILVSSSTHYIFKVTRKGHGSYEPTILAGCGRRDRIDGRAESSMFDFPHGLAVDEDDHSCYVADYWNSAIRKISFI